MDLTTIRKPLEITSHIPYCSIVFWYRKCDATIAGSNPVSANLNKKFNLSPFRDNG